MIRSGHRERIRQAVALIGLPVFVVLAVLPRSAAYATGVWTPQSTGALYGLNAVAFANASDGWAVGDFGNVFATTNGGVTWTRQTPVTDNNLNAVAAVSATEAVTVGDGGTVLITTNGGTTWTPETSGDPWPLSSVTFANASCGWASGDGTLIATTNGGVTWAPQTWGSYFAWPYSVSFANASDGWAVGYYDGPSSTGPAVGFILATTNGGTTWTTETVPVTNGSPPITRLYSVSFANVHDGWAVGQDAVGGGVVLATTDGGSTWALESASSTSLSSVAFANSQDGWAVGPGGILATTDGGSTWSAQQTPGSYYGLDSVCFPDVSHGWTVGGNSILAYSVPTYVLTYAAGINGSIVGSSTQSVTSGGSGAAVTAVPDGSYRFVDWSDGSTLNPRTDSNVQGDLGVTALFAPSACTLSYTAGANGSIAGSSTQVVNYGYAGTAVTAVPNNGYQFLSWSDGSIDNPRTDSNVTGDVGVTAQFAPNTCALSYIAGANGTITGSSHQTVAYGADGTSVTAVPSSGYHFVGWSDGSTDDPRTDTNVTANISVTADFEANGAAGSQVIQEGTSGNPFHLQSPTVGQDLAARGSNDQYLVMPYVWQTVYHDSTADPRSMQVLSDGSVLFADGFGNRVLRVAQTGQILWDYEYTYQGSVQQMWSAWLRTDGPDAGDVIVVLRGAAQPPTFAAVLEVIPAAKAGGLPSGSGGTLRWPAWQAVQSSTDVAGGPAALRDPFFASPVPGTDHTLVADGKKGGGGYRVVELDKDRKLVWQYGTLGTPGTATGQLEAPHSAQRLPNGDTLIVDEGAGTAFDQGRVLQVPSSSNNLKPKWVFSAGLNAPGGAWQLPDGNTVIADQNNNRIVTIDKSQNIIDVYGTGETDRLTAGGTLANPRAVYCTDVGLPSLYAGWTFVADQLVSRVMKYGYAGSATAVSTQLDPNAAYADKTWASIQLDFSNAAHGTASVEYSIDGGAWVSPGAPQSTSPAIYHLATSGDQPIVGRSMRYRVTLTSLQHDSAPVLDDVKIGWLPPGQSGPKTSLSISSKPASVRLPNPFVLSGTLQRAAANGLPVVVYVKKPGSGRWSYSSARLTFGATGSHSSWWYRYTPKLHGTYSFYVKFAGAGVYPAAPNSATIKVAVK